MDREIQAKVLAASRALDNNNLTEAARLVGEVEIELPGLAAPEVRAQIGANLGGVMIDLGDWSHDESLVQRGTELAAHVLRVLSEDRLTVDQFYNAANGHSILWRMNSHRAFDSGELHSDHGEAKRLYRRALEFPPDQLGRDARQLRCQVLVNYANCLESTARSVEAIEYYDLALRLDNTMSQAAGNKGLTLAWLAPLARGHTHLFLLEAERLLDIALQRPAHAAAARAFRGRCEAIERFIRAHDDFQAETVEVPDPTSPFEEFLRRFCIQHGLYLTPTALVGRDEQTVSGDPMFISQMIAPLNDDDKFDRYVTYLNQIKQDYVLARYCLVQSQYRSPAIDCVDHGVSLYYPLDYSVHSAYVQMLKTAFRLAVDVLDKIALFIHEYCQVRSIEAHRTNFRNLWSALAHPLNLRPELADRKNHFLFALFDMALDLRRGGHYDFIYERRNALTHRFLVICDAMYRPDVIEGVPRVTLDRFTQECITTMKLVRAAVIYLILFVDVEERQAASEAGPSAPTFGTPVDETFRWIPPHPGR